MGNLLTTELTMEKLLTSFKNLPKLIHFSVQNKDHRVVMVGLDGAGKTTILFQLKLQRQVPTIPTVGFNVESVEYKNIKMCIWDIGGQDKMRCIWRNYYQDVSCIIFVVDSHDKKRLDVAKLELEKMLKEESLASAALLVIANKQDYANVFEVQDLITELELDKIRSRKWKVQPCVATTGSGLWQGVDWVALQLAERQKGN